MTSRQVECGKTEKGPSHTPHGRLRTRNTKMETSEVQAERIRYPRSRGHSLVALQDRRIRITIDRVLRARWKIILLDHFPDGAVDNVSPCSILGQSSHFLQRLIVCGVPPSSVTTAARSSKLEALFIALLVAPVLEEARQTALGTKLITSRFLLSSTSMSSSHVACVSADSFRTTAIHLFCWISVLLRNFRLPLEILVIPHALPVDASQRLVGTTDLRFGASGLRTVFRVTLGSR